MAFERRVWRFIERLTILTMLVASVAMTWSVYERSRTEARTIAPDGALDADGDIPEQLLRTAVTVGSPDAAVALVEFSDYQCPFCARYAKEVRPALQQEFVDTGKVKYVFINFPLETLHKNARRASEAAECAGKQGNYIGMHDKLFANQQALTETRFMQHATDLGLDVPSFQSCMEAGLSEKIDGHVELGKRFGLDATPVFLLGKGGRDGSVHVKKRINGALPYEAFASALRDLVG